MKGQQNPRCKRLNTEYKLLQQWSELRKNAQTEKDPQKLIAKLNEIDDLLCEIEAGLVEDIEQTPGPDSNTSPSTMQESGASD